MKTRIHPRAVFLLSLPLLSLWLAGCGGGSGGGSAADSDQPFQYGPLSGRAAATNPPVVSNGSGASVVGLTGQITALELYATTPFLQTSKIAFASTRDGNYEIYTMNADGSAQTRLTNNGDVDLHPSWQPVRRRRLLGAGGLMGSSAHGFIFARNGEGARSIVTFSAATSFDTLLLSALTPSNTTGPSIFYVVEGATTAVTLTSLRYWNLDEYKPVTPALSTGTALHGALISFSSATGRVDLVLPYTAPNRSVGGEVCVRVCRKRAECACCGVVLWVCLARAVGTWLWGERRRCGWMGAQGRCSRYDEECDTSDTLGRGVLLLPLVESTD